MNTQQRRPFFQARQPGGSSLTTINWGRITRVLSCERILAILTALLFLGCASLAPNRVAVLAAIAQHAAYIGASDWLAKHPEHKAGFDAVIFALTALARNNNTNETAFVELISSLPTSTLAGPEGELYVTEADLVIWDSALKKAVEVKGPAVQPVMKATLSGLKRAVAPLPPVPEPVPLVGTNRVRRR